MRASTRLFALPVAAALTLAACGDADLPADEQNGSAIDGSASGSAIDDATAEAATGGGFASDAADEDTMPPAIRGRWGLVAADCTSTRGDAKGLIDISADSIKFYESRATIADVTARSDDAIRGDFDFVGEGQQWSLDMTWALENDGQTLVRSETGADAAPDPLEYQKCE